MDAVAGAVLMVGAAAVAACLIGSVLVAILDLLGLVYSPSAEERQHRADGPVTLSPAARRLRP